MTTKCSQLKMMAPDGKIRLRDTLDTEGIFRLIESVPSPNAEPLKLWLAKLGRQEVDNVFDPSKGIDKMIDYYLKKGYDLDWIESRIKAITNPIINANIQLKTPSPKAITILFIV